MKTRPLAIWVTAVVFLCVGIGGMIAGPWRFLSAANSMPLDASRSHELFDVAMVVLSGAIAVLGATLLLNGRRWGRWLIVFWTAAHVVLSMEHDRLELAIHALLLVVVVWLLYRKDSSAYLARPATA